MNQTISQFSSVQIQHIHDMYLTVLDETNISSPFTETLSLHINSILADESHASLATSDAALTGSLSVILGMGGVKLVGYTCLGHFVL